MTDLLSGDLVRTLNIAGARVAEGWLDQAEEMLRAVLAEHGANDTAHRLMGIVAFKLGRQSEGIGHLQRAAELAPATFAHWSDLGVAYRTADDDLAAEAAFQRARQTPDAPKMWNGQVPEAVRGFSTDDGVHRFKVIDYQYEAHFDTEATGRLTRA